ncbi:16S rRNA (guanine(966)-N(2))-methyltransferase RsmD [Desulforhopalus singaporensis]|uniref:16S rRNA (Guanine966-N2)-methyltransferase n=1 Tax=Desulforhopalus singaporensis TaxID=91360 RepID=A0A1H0MPC6_9BACT|nr:16S rRNA (guanine(966)-N(2))-methyltransferase RsmD [Desulforhopalus singaporensis]SDO82155.1 16S rRNA (guanine966-N2)-methyltransferase [Desulforhopalus singaporensis]
MRIISGFARGMRLAAPPGKNKTIRPTSDRAREALFSIIGSKIVGAAVLDLCSGTGAVGLEALSRNARSVIMIDHTSLALQLIKKNVLSCLKGAHPHGEVKVIKHDLTLKFLKKVLPEDTTHKGFDLIFADPPYGTGIGETVLDIVARENLLKPTGILILEERSGYSFPAPPEKLVFYDKRSYGEVGFFFYHVATK